MKNSSIRMVLGQLNLAVGNIPGNTKKIIAAIEKASNDKADIIIFPELSICSYPPEDLLLRPAFNKSIESALKKITMAAKDIHVILGYPLKKEEKLYNACSLIHDKKIKHTYSKRYLPNYGVFDEKRYFTPGDKPCLFEIKDSIAALSICEDIWVSKPTEDAASANAKILFNINASPYEKNKTTDREQIISKRASQSNIHIVYVNLVGGQDELIFDGSSQIYDNNGKIIFQASSFKEELFLAELDINNKKNKINTNRSEFFVEQNIYNALILGVKDYVMKNKFQGVVIGLSGGIDSALTLCIAADALGPENVKALIMPSRYTSKMSIDDASMLAKKLNVSYEIISIEPPFTSFLDILKPIFGNLPIDATEENIQARCRGLLLMAISNKYNKLVLTTGNKSEMSVGYATLYGDMAGGFSPLKDVWKTLVYKLSKWRNTQGNVIPESIINRPPTAELRDNQLDQDFLPDYEILDPILEKYIELDQHPEKIISDGYNPETVYKVTKLVDKNEYKRRQSAPGIRITNRAFGKDRRYPISSGYTEEK
jgi:NAD+ synthase (glutamine-hydrolysing)|tara:strand:- start:8479 stop:10104 length:1626 start_codon:yes stop_codon:yes gene_type:complete